MCSWLCIQPSRTGQVFRPIIEQLQSSHTIVRLMLTTCCNESTDPHLPHSLSSLSGRQSTARSSRLPTDTHSAGTLDGHLQRLAGAARAGSTRPGTQDSGTALAAAQRNTQGMNLPWRDHPKRFTIWPHTIMLLAIGFATVTHSVFFY